MKKSLQYVPPTPSSIFLFQMGVYDLLLFFLAILNLIVLVGRGMTKMKRIMPFCTQGFLITLWPQEGFFSIENYEAIMQKEKVMVK